MKGNSLIENSKIVITYNLLWLSHKADCLKSRSLIDPFELLYANILQCEGWNSAEVITSVQTNLNNC